MTPEELLEATLEKARRVPIGGKADATELTRRAIESARIEGRVRRARRGRFFAGAAAAVAVLTLGWGTWRATGGWDETERSAVSTDVHEAIQESERAPSSRVAAEEVAGGGSSAEPRRLRLASGDVLVGSPGVAFDILSEDRDRVIRLDEGEMLFDIMHQPRGSFVVRADDFSVMVLGTVFSVRRERDALGVYVFEGSVLVRGADGEVLQRLGAGNLWVSRTLDGMDEWRRRSEYQWRLIALEGHRAERRAPSASQVGRLGAGTGGEGGADSDAPVESDDEASVDPVLTSARALLAGGDFEAVLRMCNARPAEGTWLLLRADALRGLGRNDAAAQAYETAARSLGDHRRTQAAFAAAQLRAESSPESALDLLARFGVTQPSSPLEERARALRVRLLRSVGRDHDADREELAYEERFGDGGE